MPQGCSHTTKEAATTQSSCHSSDWCVPVPDQKASWTFYAPSHMKSAPSIGCYGRGFRELPHRTGREKAFAMIRGALAKIDLWLRFEA